MASEAMQLEAGPIRHKAGWLERWLGVELYRMVRGLFTNPLSVIGLLLLALFLFIAAAAPILAPPRAGADPYQIPRDGYGSVPKPPGEAWTKRAPDLPFWWKAIVGTDEWIHLMGTASGQWDIYYGASGARARRSWLAWC